MPAALIGSLVVLTAGALIPGLPSPSPRLPSPNGYDDLEQAGASFRGQWPKARDLALADPGEIRALVEANAEVLARARVGLGRESMVSIEDSREGLAKHLESLGRIRTVSRLLEAESLARQADGRFAEAARSLRDELALGQAMTQGGMGIDVSTGWFIQKRAIDGLRRIKARLPAETIRPVLAELEDLDRRRVTPDEVASRWSHWYGASHRLWERTMFRWSGIEKKGRADELALAKSSRDKIERDLRFSLVELAIHAYHEERRAWPRSAGDLVPAYLSSVPIDPATGKALDYPANPAGELTDDLDAIARPGGEVTPAP